MKTEQRVIIKAPKFYCHNYCSAVRNKQCQEQCSECSQIVAETRAKPRNTKDVTFVKQ